ncbi:MAG: lysylphosphatidylglycerol synthase transmembrane domain-containing protein, partial [Novipirellula sp. JB048]
MHLTWKRSANIALKFAIPVAIIAWLANHIDWALLSAQPKDYPLLVAALAVALVGVSLSFARWCLLVRCQGISLSMLEAFRLGSIGFLLNFVSAGSVGGDLFKAIFLAKQRPGKRVQAVASVVVDRGVGLFGLLVLVAAGLMLISPTATTELDRQQMQQIRGATATLMTIGSIVLGVLVLGGKGIDHLVRWGSGLSIVGPVVAKVGPPLRMFQHHPIAFLISILMSLGVHAAMILSMYLIARGLYADPPTLVEHFVIVPIGMLAAAMPITPAGLGVYEATIAWLYKIVPRSEERR